MIKLEPKKVPEEVICEYEEGDFLGFELEEVVNESKEELFEDDLNLEFESKDIAFFKTNEDEVQEVTPLIDNSSVNSTMFFLESKSRRPNLVHDRKVHQFDLSSD